MVTWSQNPYLDNLVTKKAPFQSQRPVSRVNYEPQADAGSAAFRMFNVADDMGGFTPSADPQYDWIKKAEELAYQTAQIRAEAVAQRMKNASIRGANSTIRLPNINVQQGGGGQGGPRFQRFIQAISGQESGGDYGAVNSDSGALGKYQIMPSNFSGSGGWDMEALGRDITTQRFLNSPRIQERIARHKLREYFNNYGARGAASAWYSGDPNKWQNSSPQGGYPSIAAYVRQIMRRMRALR